MTTKLPCDLGCNSSDAMVEYDNGYKCFSCGKYKHKKRSICADTRRIYSAHVEDRSSTEITKEFKQYLKALNLDNMEFFWSDKYQAMGISLYFLSNKVGTAYRTTLNSKAKSNG